MIDRQYYSYVNRKTGLLWGEPVKLTDAEVDEYRTDCGRYMKKLGYVLKKIPKRKALVRTENLKYYEEISRKDRDD